MARTAEDLRSLLRLARADRREAEGSLGEVKGSLSRLDDIAVSYDASFPKTNEALREMEGNLREIEEYSSKFGVLIETAKATFGIPTLIDSIKSDALRRLNELDELMAETRFAEAFAALDEIEEFARSIDLGAPLQFQQTLLDVCAWKRCDLFAAYGENNILLELDPLNPEEYAEYSRRAVALPIGVRSSAARSEHIDRLRGYACLLNAKKIINGKSSHSLLLSALSFYADVNSHSSSFSALTAKRFAYYRGVLVDLYNFLCLDAFDTRRNYDDAKALFLLKDRFELEEVAHPAYHDSDTETDFRIEFLVAEGIKMDEDLFWETAKEYSAKVSNPEEIEFKVMVRWINDEKISERKQALLIQAISSMSFYLMIRVFAETLKGLPSFDRQSDLLDALLAKKEKSVDLEEAAGSLLFIKGRIDETLRPAFTEMLQSLLRSPLAHKVAVKSNVAEVHVLYGEDIESFRRPIGKPMKSSVVKSWDFALKGLYYAFGLLLPIVFCVIGASLIVALLRDNPLCPFLLFVPLMLILIVVTIFLVQRFGRDERGSAIARRMLFVDALVRSAVGLAYFIAPVALSSLAPCGYTLILFSAVEGLWAYAVFKDRNKVASVLLSLPLLLFEAGALVFLIIDLMNGLI